MFNVGEKITVISTDHRNGFVRQDGTFSRYINDYKGAPFMAEYLWNGMCASVFLGRVRMESRSAPARFH